jgi:two-component system, NtrC family, response regulator AtoC
MLYFHFQHPSMLWQLSCNMFGKWSRSATKLMPSTSTQSVRIGPGDLPDGAVIFGSTAAMREVQYRVDRVLHKGLPVLIRGERGTGKETLARFLHSRSERHDAPFAKFNCAATPTRLRESELFGCENGAFAGASGAKHGLVEVADGGTIFLEEVGDLDWMLQAKLLQLLQDGRFVRAGGCEERQARVRIIGASTIDINAAVEAGTFRRDFFYEIDVIRLHLLSLRDRKEDIPQLCDYFLQKLAKRLEMRAPRLTSTTLDLLKQWNWPGNLRERKNWIARFIILGGDEQLTAELSRQVASFNTPDDRQTLIGHLKETSQQAVSTAQRRRVPRALPADRWDCERATEELDMSDRTLLCKELRDTGAARQRNGYKGDPPLVN